MKLANRRRYFFIKDPVRAAAWTVSLAAILLFVVYGIPAIDHFFSWAFPKPPRYR